MNSVEIDTAFPFFDELYSTFWSGYLNLSFVDRGWIAWISLMTLAIIGCIVIRKMPGILQLTFLPTFYAATYQFNGQDINRGFQIMSNDTALSDFVNMSFTLIWLMLWGGIIGFVVTILFFGFGGAIGEIGKALNSESSPRNKFKEPKGILEHLDCIERERKINSLRDKKHDLEFERSQLITSNHVWGIPINNLSSSELEHNRKKCDRLSKEIGELDNELNKLDNNR